MRDEITVENTVNEIEDQVAIEVVGEPVAKAAGEATEAEKPKGKGKGKGKAKEAVTHKLGAQVFYMTTSGTPRPAIITRVHDGKTVDLTVFNSQGAVPATGVALDPELAIGTCY